MAISRRQAQQHAEALLQRPRSDTPVVLRRNRNGYVLLHAGRALTKTHASKVGETQAAFMAEALGVDLPQGTGDEVRTQVATGVLYRAIAISSLDLRKPEARVLLGQLIQTALMQRSAFTSVEI